MKRGGKGFTLIELLLVVAITGVIVAPLSMATITLLVTPQQTVDQSTVLHQVQNVGYWLSRDVQMARSVNATGANGFPLTLSIPVDADEANDYSIIYLVDGSTLKRQFYDSGGSLTAETLIANYIDADNTTFSTMELGVYELTVRAVRDEAMVTRSYEVQQRLSLASSE